MEILLWLVPPLVVTLSAMAWAGWLGRESRGRVDPDDAVRRLGAALERDVTPPAGRARRPRLRSTGVALRRTAPDPAGGDTHEGAAGEIDLPQPRAS